MHKVTVPGLIQHFIKESKHLYSESTDSVVKFGLKCCRTKIFCVCVFITS